MTEQVPIPEGGGYVIVGPWGWADQPPLPLEEEGETDDA